MNEILEILQQHPALVSAGTGALASLLYAWYKRRHPEVEADAEVRLKRYLSALAHAVIAASPAITAAGGDWRKILAALLGAIAGSQVAYTSGSAAVNARAAVAARREG